MRYLESSDNKVVQRFPLVAAVCVLFMQFPTSTTAQVVGTLPPVESNATTTIIESNIFNSPFYNDSDSLISAKSTALGAALISGLSGNPVNSAHLARTSTLLGICKAWSDAPLPLSQLPLVLQLGSHGTRYYAGAATINPVFIVSITLFFALGCLIFAKATDNSFTEGMRRLKFPNTVVFPYLFLIQPSVMCALTVILNSPDTVLVALSGVGLGFWVLTFIALLIWLIKIVPEMARYVPNFRHETVDSKAQKNLLDKCKELENRRKAREEAKRKAKRDAELKLERASSVGHTLRSKKDRLMSSLAGVFANMARDDEDEKKKTEDTEDVDSDEELAQVIEKQAQFEYAKLLSVSLDDTAVDDEGALQKVLRGDDRWVDFAHNDEEEDDDNVKTTDIEGIHPSIGFVRRYGLFFAKYRRKAYFFLLVELVVSYLCGLIEGWRPSTADVDGCIAPASCLCALMFLYLAVMVTVHPYISSFEHLFCCTIALLQFIASIFVVVSLTLKENYAQVVTYVMTVCMVYLLALKSLMDLYSAIIPFLQTKTLVWPTIRPLTRAYLNDEPAAKSTVERRKRRLTTVARLLQQKEDKEKRRLERRKVKFLQGKNPDEDSGEDEEDEEEGEEEDKPLIDTAGTDAATSRADGKSESNFSTATTGSNTKSKFELRTVTQGVLSKAMEEELGGRKTMFVCSRGVPESFHPFHQRPLPERLPLPQRSAQESQRRLEKAAKERRKAYWGAAFNNTFKREEEQEQQKQDGQVTTSVAEDEHDANKSSAISGAPMKSALKASSKSPFNAKPQHIDWDALDSDDELLQSDSDDDMELNAQKQAYLVKRRKEKKVQNLFGQAVAELQKGHKQGKGATPARTRWHDVFDHLQQQHARELKKIDTMGRTARNNSTGPQGLTADAIAAAEERQREEKQRAESGEGDNPLLVAPTVTYGDNPYEDFPYKKRALKPGDTLPGLRYRETKTDLKRGILSFHNSKRKPQKSTGEDDDAATIRSGSSRGTSPVQSYGAPPSTQGDPRNEEERIMAELDAMLGENNSIAFGRQEISQIYGDRPLSPDSGRQSGRPPPIATPAADVGAYGRPPSGTQAAEQDSRRQTKQKVEAGDVWRAMMEGRQRGREITSMQNASFVSSQALGSPFSRTGSSYHGSPGSGGRGAGYASQHGSPFSGSGSPGGRGQAPGPAFASPRSALTTSRGGYGSPSFTPNRTQQRR